MGMIVGHPVPSQITWSLSGTGAAFLSTVQIGMRPGAQTAIRWLSGTQTTSSVLKLRGEWTGAVVPGMLHIAGTSLPAGTKITVAWRRSSDPDGTYPYAPSALNNPQRIVAGPRGGKSCTIILEPGATEVVGVEVTIWNDVDGSASIEADSTFTISAVIPCSTTDVRIAAGVETAMMDPTVTSNSMNRTSYSAASLPYRQMSCAFRTASLDDWMEQYEQLIACIDRGQYAVYVPRSTDTAGAFSARIAQAEAMIGVATKLPSRKHVALEWHSAAGLVVDEVPVPA